MKNLFLILFFFLLPLFVSHKQQAFAQNKDSVQLKRTRFDPPTEINGFKVRYATLSKGKYQEIFSNDTIQQIGSVLFNRVTGEVVGEVPKDSLYFPADVSSRWWSVDPLAEKYPELSPYVFVANNPIKYIDPDGREIWIGYQVKNAEGKTETYEVQYKQGKLFNKDGSEYNGDNKYVALVASHLDLLRTDNEVAKERLETLETSEQIHKIRRTDNAKDGNTNTADSGEKERAGEPTGSLTKYNPLKTTNNSGDVRHPRASLAHELLGHGYDADQGKKDKSKTSNGIPMSEVNAVNMENRIRSATGDSQRTTYGGKPIPKKLLIKTHK